MCVCVPYAAELNENRRVRVFGNFIVIKMMLVAILPSFPYLNRLYLVKSTQKLHTTHGWCAVHIKVYTSTLNFFLWHFRFWFIWMLFACWTNIWSTYLTVKLFNIETKLNWGYYIFMGKWNVDQNERIRKKSTAFSISLDHLKVHELPIILPAIQIISTHFRLIHSNIFNRNQHALNNLIIIQMFFDSNTWNETWG